MTTIGYPAHSISIFSKRKASFNNINVNIKSTNDSWIIINSLVYLLFRTFLVYMLHPLVLRQHLRNSFALITIVFAAVDMQELLFFPLVEFYYCLTKIYAIFCRVYTKFFKNFQGIWNASLKFITAEAFPISSTVRPT